MVVSEILEGISVTKHPSRVLMTVIQLVRSHKQQEKATFAGCFGEYIDFINKYGQPTAKSVIQYIEDLGHIEIPDNMVLEFLSEGD